MDNKLKEIILEVLKADERLWDDEKKELNQTLLLDLIEKIDENIINLLLNKKELRDKFFIKIKDAYVFKTNDFRFFMEENKVDNSYTAYERRIGLSDGKRFISNNNLVVLDFPYKDCVLEGGQSTEEGIDSYFEYLNKIGKYEQKQAKRKEIFFNEILAKDEIDRLFDEKAFVNWKRYTVKGEEKVGEIKRDENGTIRENIIIKGNNLLALHSLKKQFAGKVKLIYIDPPYNTGNDEIKYNDNFNHSAWLTFMKNRLEVAKELLSYDGSIYINIDYNELHYLKVLMDEIFGKDNFQREIIWRMGFLSGYKTKVENYIRNHDTILFYSKNREKVFFNKEKAYIYNHEFKPILKPTKETEKIFEKYVINSNKIQELLEEINYKNRPKRYPLEDTWNCNKYDDLDNIAIENSTSRIEETVVIDDKNFKGQKREKLLKRIIEVSTNPGDIVLDFVLGTGTTCAVAHKLNRQYIGIEQLDYGDNDSVKRLQNVINGDQSGVSKAINWHGGGDFIYFELAKWNETAKEKILETKSLDELEKLFDELYYKYFLNYNLKIKEFKEKVILEKEFKTLPLNEQKKMFLTMLDLNQMYVQKTEMADEKFGIKKKDQDLTLKFYGDD